MKNPWTEIPTPHANPNRRSSSAASTVSSNSPSRNQATMHLLYLLNWPSTAFLTPFVFSSLRYSPFYSNMKWPSCHSFHLMGRVKRKLSRLGPLENMPSQLITPVIFLLSCCLLFTVFTMRRSLMNSDMSNMKTRLAPGIGFDLTTSYGYAIPSSRWLLEADTFSKNGSD